MISNDNINNNLIENPIQDNDNYDLLNNKNKNKSQENQDQEISNIKTNINHFRNR